MKKLILILIFSIFAFMLIQKNIYAQLPPYNPNYQLVFFDEFDSLHINSSSWSKEFNWGNMNYTITDLDQDGIKDDTVYTKCYMPNSERNFNFDTIGTGKISLVTMHETTPYSGFVWNYDIIDTISIDHHILFSGLNSTGHSIGTYRDTLFTSDLLVVNRDSIYTIDSLHIALDSIHRMYNTQYENYDYTTAMLRSYNKYRFGYFELRFKLPHLGVDSNNQGVGPNFWLWDANKTIPWSEIDIFEIKDDYWFQNPGTYKHMHTAATHITPDSLSDLENEAMYFNQLDFCNTCYRKFSVLWDDKNIIYYTDDNKLWESNNHPDKMLAMPIIIGNSIPINGVNLSAIMPDTAHTVLPYNYDIDYVKVYQLKQYCDSEVAITAFNPDDFGYGLYKTISLGSSGSNSTVQSGKVVPLMATDEITINGTFTVELGAEFSIETRPCLPQADVNKNLQQGIQSPPPDSFIKTFFPHQY